MCLTVNGKDIMESEKLKLPGVTIDCDFDFSVYVSNESQPENWSDRGVEKSYAN